MKRELKVFEFSYKIGEKDWVAAYSLIHAIQTITSETALNLYDFDWDDEIREVPQEELKALVLGDGDGENLQTYVDYVAQMEGAGMIATTAY